MRMLFFVVCLVIALPTAAFADKRVAFLVGNSNYENSTKLDNPGRDVELIAPVLRDLGFSVTVHFDLTRQQIGRELSLFLKDSSAADLTVFYFAGHGMQFEGRNYLLGIDAALETEFDIEAEALDLGRVTRLLEQGSKASIVFIDACRNNPLATRFYTQNFSATRAFATRGLAPPQAGHRGTMLMFSAAPGQVAYDGEDYSPFAEALAKHLPTPNIEVLTLMKRITGDVRAKTDRKQVPLVSNDLVQEIYLKLDTGDTGGAIARRQEELMFEAALNIGNLRGWDLYFDKFPNGFFKDIAQLERDRILGGEGQETGSGAQNTASRQDLASAAPQAGQSEQLLGVTEDDAKAIQTALNKRGYTAGAVDGIIGRGTRQAIADFQAATGLASTGVIDTATAEALGISVEKPERSVIALVSSDNARRYDPTQLELLETDKRLIRAASVLKDHEYIYGFFDGRVYLAVLTWGFDWQRSSALAQKAGGHLVTLASREENQFVHDLFARDERLVRTSGDGQRKGPWIGLRQEDNSREPSGGWHWVTNEPLTYTNWNRGQPNNYGGSENYGSMHSFGSLEPETEQRALKWDDLELNGSPSGFIMEID